jgi:hypothetical protein
MSGSSAGFKRPGAACENCDKPFPLSLAIKGFRSVEKLPDPFVAKCYWCGHEGEYSKSDIHPLVSVG